MFFSSFFYNFQTRFHLTIALRSSKRAAQWFVLPEYFAVNVSGGYAYIIIFDAEASTN